MDRNASVHESPNAKFIEKKKLSLAKLIRSDRQKTIADLVLPVLPGAAFYFPRLPLQGSSVIYAETSQFQISSTAFSIKVASHVS